MRKRHLFWTAGETLRQAQDRVLAVQEKHDVAGIVRCGDDRLPGLERSSMQGSPSALHPSALQEKIDQALDHHRAGRLAAAEELYRQVLVIDPRHADGLHLLGIIADQAGRHDAAAELIRRAIAVSGQRPDFHLHLGRALKAQGDVDGAIASYRRAVDLSPDLADAHNGMGLALQARGRPDEALASLARAIELAPRRAIFHHNRANVLRDQGRLEEALSSLAVALAFDPALAESHNLQADALYTRGKLAEALASYERALALKPTLVEAHFNRSNILNTLGRYDESLACLDRVLALEPKSVPAHGNRGKVLNNQGRFDEALASYERAIALDPTYSTAHRDRGIALQNLGRFEEAVECFERASVLEPASFEHAFMAKFAFPALLASAEGIADQRARLRRNVDELMDFPGQLGSVEHNACGSIFFLAYHDFDDRLTLEALCRLFRAKAPPLSFEAPHIKAWRPPAEDGRSRIRIGFASEYFRSHTIGRLYAGLIRNLDRARFEIVLIHDQRAQRDALTERLEKDADRTLVLPLSLAEQQKAIAALSLDMLFYPDIGMSRVTYFLAYSRLAPVQAVSWGHPNTTGLDTFDYFVSTAGAEPPQADRQYTERLVALNRLPCFYEPPAVPQGTTRTAFGLPEAGTLYGCPQSLFKLHPDFDAVLAEIAAGDPQGTILLLEGQYPTWSGLLRQRWAATHPELIERVRFLPRLPADRFLALLAHFDVLLDPIHFGSGNTLYEAMTHGTPIVTWPGRFMRGRIVAAAYRQMGIADAPIAERLEDYAPLALALGRDPARRAALRRASRAAAGALFEDRQAVRDFEAFAIAAVEAAGRNEKLPPGWRPGLQ
jgi:predicted O-linked N-acetylglucosamine transferase (SPINDLY family)